MLKTPAIALRAAAAVALGAALTLGGRGAGPAGSAAAAQTILWGDANCGGAVGADDALALLRHVAALPAGQSPPCPGIGTAIEITDSPGTAATPWGDADCDGTVTTVDGLATLRFVAGLAVSQSEPCPDIGALVQVTGVAPSLWHITRGGPQTDEAWGVDVDSAGNVYWATHQTVPGPWPDMIVYKLAPDGTQLWEKRWGGPWAEEAFIVVVEGPIVYIAGFTQHAASLNATDLAVIALDTADGTLEWEFTWDQGFGYEEADGLVKDGNFLYVAGWTTGEGTSNDIVILKLDLGGNLVWARTWGTPGWDEANGQIAVSADRIYVAGRYNAPNALVLGDAVLAAFSKASGDIVDFETWGSSVFDDALGLAADGPDLYVVGVSANQVFLRKHGPDLSLEWEAEWGGSASEAARVAEVDAQGILVAGKTSSTGAGKDDIALLRYSRDGDLLWESTWGGPGFDVSHGLAAHDGVAYIAAETDSFGAGKLDALLVRVNAATGAFPEP